MARVSSAAWSLLRPYGQPHTALPIAIEDTGCDLCCFEEHLSEAHHLSQPGTIQDHLGWSRSAPKGSLLGMIHCLTMGCGSPWLQEYGQAYISIYLGTTPSVNSGPPIHLGRPASFFGLCLVSSIHARCFDLMITF
ncbi:hypothetical protein E4T43_01966 [Aureobasidium subglaciale]|nr:hypothetical protein E4T43_01966 [Aureobasidium subglaciale]